MSRRLRKVNEAIREVVSQALETAVKDPRLGFVTVTGVETAPDLRAARVYVSVLGDEAQRADSLLALQSSHGVLQSALAARLRLKRTPRLEFAYDVTTDRALHIYELLAAEEAQIAALSGQPVDERGDEENQEAGEGDETPQGPAGGGDAGSGSAGAPE